MKRNSHTICTSGTPYFDRLPLAIRLFSSLFFCCCKILISNRPNDIMRRWNILFYSIRNSHLRAAAGVACLCRTTTNWRSVNVIGCRRQWMKHICMTFLQIVLIDFVIDEHIWIALKQCVCVCVCAFPQRIFKPLPPAAREAISNGYNTIMTTIGERHSNGINVIASSNLDSIFVSIAYKRHCLMPPPAFDGNLTKFWIESSVLHHHISHPSTCSVLNDNNSKMRMEFSSLILESRHNRYAMTMTSN